MLFLIVSGRFQRRTSREVWILLQPSAKRKFAQLAFLMFSASRRIASLAIARGYRRTITCLILPAMTSTSLYSGRTITSSLASWSTVSSANLPERNLENVEVGIDALRASSFCDSDFSRPRNSCAYLLSVSAFMVFPKSVIDINNTLV